ncbi:hypothetical protein LTS18_004453 [Coniosporium uncinatum]|uniref:Uncharacterized protein n=1 Tax=Coniosporium uncinatum TaxID=93489 RepID=A0ACC3D623_9PEZI|nr:hypothetical protein LTS18_004453 [Coniosporium uncinatum]
MNDFITSTSNKSVRIWGTFPPKNNATNVDKSVAVQHWAAFEDNALHDFIRNGYPVLNSYDAFYIVTKYSGSYRQSLNLSAVFHADPSVPGGGPFYPGIFNWANASDNAQRGDPRVLGYVAPLWNDYGPNATTVLETFWAWRDGLPGLADKLWGGRLGEDEYGEVFGKLVSKAPGQNLERRVRSKGDVVVEYDFTQGAGRGSKGEWHDRRPDGRHGQYMTGEAVEDRSDNGYDARTDCELLSDRGIHITPHCSLRTPLSSRGRNYTLSMTLYPTSSAPGQLLIGRDSQLLLGNGTSDQVMLVSGGNAYALNYTLPTKQWSDVSLIGRGNATFFKVNGEMEMQFLTRIGVNGERFVEREIAIEAPLAVLGGRQGGFEGWVRHFKLISSA